MGAQAPFYFDNSVHDIYGALYAGARLVLIPEELLMFPSKIPEFLVEKGCTSVFWVPTVMINIANSGVLGTVPMPRLKLVSFAGEVMPNAPLNVWRQAHPDSKGNIRDEASLQQLIVLANMESINAELIRQGVPQSERLLRLNASAKQMMQSLTNDHRIEAFKEYGTLPHESE